jgi:hypothetical protein
MLKWISIFCCLIALSDVNAQDTLKILPQTSVEQDRPLQKINVKDLPEVIKEKISGEQYSGWRLKGAYRTVPRKANDSETDNVDYVVELKKEQETIRVRFDGQGARKDD